MDVVVLIPEFEEEESQRYSSKRMGRISRNVWVLDGIMAQMANFQEVLAEGTPEEKKELIRLFVEGIELDVEKRVARCRIKKFPAPKDLDAGKLSFGLVAGAGFEPATFGL